MGEFGTERGFEHIVRGDYGTNKCYLEVHNERLLASLSQQITPESRIENRKT